MYQFYFKFLKINLTSDTVQSNYNFMFFLCLGFYAS